MRSFRFHIHVFLINWPMIKFGVPYFQIYFCQAVQMEPGQLCVFPILEIHIAQQCVTADRGGGGSSTLLRCFVLFAAKHRLEYL